MFKAKTFLQQMEDRIRDLNQKLQERARQRNTGNNVGKANSNKVVIVDPLLADTRADTSRDSDLTPQSSPARAEVVVTHDLIESSPVVADDSSCVEEDKIF